MYNETPPPQEQEKLITPTEVVSVLKEQGLNEEGLAILNRWIDQEQGRVEAGTLTNLKLNVMWADIYKDAGLTEHALDAYEQAYEEARQEGRLDVQEICMREILLLTVPPV